MSKYPGTPCVVRNCRGIEHSATRTIRLALVVHWHDGLLCEAPAAFSSSRRRLHNSRPLASIDFALLPRVCFTAAT